MLGDKRTTLSDERKGIYLISEGMKLATKKLATYEKSFMGSMAEINNNEATFPANLHGLNYRK